ncbi:oxidoreductase C-terminal domain-containing protein [Phaeacidiphilus oryzae]|uniref:oxidoreductase C-terminal domain-containing protein n=1 Tax=Phaeacidiphilus oryzae TaxID=348818 RepID=UPI001F247B5B|nr:oxidoreductase C-terminal domain-containing protein [Phaeacidiphilus oryzae]
MKLQIAGLPTGHDRTVLRGDPATERFSVLYYRAERLLCAECVNSPADYMAARRALDQGATFPPRAAADVSVPLKTLLPSPPKEATAA